jgi:hypothetical protein
MMPAATTQHRGNRSSGGVDRGCGQMGKPERGRHEDLTSPLEPHRAKRKSASLSQLFAHKDSSDTSKGLMRIPLLFNENFVEMEPSASRPHDAGGAASTALGVEGQHLFEDQL